MPCCGAGGSPPHHLTGRLLTVAAGALLACSGGTEPTPTPPRPATFSATVAIQRVDPPSYDALPEGIALISCVMTLQSTGHGVAGATWREAIFRWYPANDLRTAFDSATISAQEVVQSWGDADIRDGVDQVSRWQLLATIPFTARLEYRYRVSGAAADSSASAVGTCQPPIPPTATGPTLSEVLIQPSGPSIEPGDTLSVSFRANATAGLWQSIVSVTGACDTTFFFPGGLTQSTPYSIQIPVSAGCVLGASLSVSILTVDAALQTAVTIPVMMTVIDHTPPVLTVSDAAGGGALAGDFFTGDTIQLVGSAIDNDLVTWFIWEAQPAGVRDSVLLSSLRNPPFVPLIVRASWGAFTGFSFTALDRSGNRSTPATINTDSLRLHPIVQRPTASRFVAGDTRQVLPDTKRGVVYLTQSIPQHQILTVALADGALVRTLALPSYGGVMDLSASGDSLLMTFPGIVSLGVLALTAANPQFTLLPLVTPDTALGQTVGTVFAMSDGTAFVGLGGLTTTTLEVLQVDLATGSEQPRPAGGANGVARLLERGPNHDRLLVSDDAGSAQVYQTATDQFGSMTAYPNNGGRFGFSTDGQVIAEGLTILDSNLQFVRNVRGYNPNGVVASFLAPDGQSLSYVTEQGLVRTRVSDGEILDRSPMPFSVSSFQVSSDGDWVVFRGQAGGTTGQVGAIDLR